ncbi:MAG: pilus assembly protein [Myxococcales bacterium]|nr:pilus assembly protein [Myxococcales bacterium]
MTSAPKPLSDARGAVLLEFLIAFFPIFVLFLGTLQLSLLMAARIIVRHAAVTGARAAVVILDDDPQHYDGAPRGELQSGTPAHGDWERRVGGLLGKALPPSPPAVDDGARMADIRRAVHLRLATLVPEPMMLPTLATGGGLTVQEGLGGAPVGRLGLALLGYLPLTTAVTFPTSPGADKLVLDRIDAQDTLTVRVTHAFACTIPWASQIICKRLFRHKLNQPLASKRRTSSPERRAERELQLAPGASRQWQLSALPVALIQAEATMPAHPAPYRYRSEKKR